MTEQKITPCLWFNFNAEEAVAHYLSIFKNGRIVSTALYGETGPGPRGAVMTILFEIEGQRFLALNGGPQFAFTPAISLIVDCADSGRGRPALGAARRGRQARPMRLADRQVRRLVADRAEPRSRASCRAATPAAIERVVRAVMPMTKLDLSRLQQAYEAK